MIPFEDESLSPPIMTGDPLSLKWHISSSPIVTISFPEETWRILHGTCKIVIYVLKPWNIMADKGYKLLILVYGTSKLVTLRYQGRGVPGGGGRRGPCPPPPPPKLTPAGLN